MLKIKHIKAQGKSDYYIAGQEICKPGNIRKVQFNKIDEDVTEVQALVMGNFGFFHTVKLGLNFRKPNVIDSCRCNCYEKTQIKSPCRHGIALALALASDGKREFDFALEPRIDPFEDDAEEITFEPQTVAATAEAPRPQQAPVQPAPETVPAVAEPEVPVIPLGDPNGMEIHLGSIPEQDGAPMVWHPNDTTRVFHTNTGIIGTMGTGKTQFTKSLIAQMYRNQKDNFYGNPLGILIFDYKGDFNDPESDFAKACNAKVLPVTRLPFNPLALVPGKKFKPLLPVHTANAFTDTIARAYRLGVKQRNILYTCIERAYENAGIVASDPKTWSKLAPTFEMVYDIYDNDREIPKNDSLEAAMQDLHRFNVFESNPYYTKSLFNLLKGVVVIDLTEAFDEKIQSLIVGLTLDQFYTQMRNSGFSTTDGTLRELTKFILVDEADNFMGRDFPALKRIMKEGREFGVGTILSTQCLDHFTTGEDDYSRYIMTWVVHNVAELKRSDVEYVFRTGSNNAETERLYNAIKNTDRFHSIVKIGNADPIHIRDKAFFEMMREEQES